MKGKILLRNRRMINWQIRSKVFVVLQGRERRNTKCIPSADNASGRQKDKAKCQVVLRQFLRPILLLTLFLLLALSHVPGFSGAVAVAASAPSEKPAQLVANEAELKQLADKESDIKKSISDETINRSKLLAQKRAELKEVRKKRDDALNKEKSDLKAKRDKQDLLVKEFKRQKTNIKKLTKNAVALAAIDISIALAEAKLNDYKAQYDAVNKKLTKSYEDYKTVYDKLTNTDLSLKKNLDKIESYERDIKTLKDEQKKQKNEYNKNIKEKNYMSAQRAMNAQLAGQKAINNNYSQILAIRKKFKSDYYVLIVNYKI